MKYVFHPEVLTEYSEAVQYYREQRAEVAQAFIDVIYVQLVSLFVWGLKKQLI